MGRLMRQPLLVLATLLISTPCFAAPQPAQTPQNPAAEAAARKKRFEEEKKKLEEGDASAQSGAETEVDADQTLFVSPSVVNLNAGDVRPFCVFDIDGKILTSSAEWALSDSAAVTLTSGAEPVITAMEPGKAILRARVGNRTAEASIAVLEGNTMPAGTIKWSVPNYPGYKTKQIVQAVPRERGPDIYTIEENAEGKSLVRAWTSEGIFLWMRKFNRRIVNAVPH